MSVLYLLQLGLVLLLSLLQSLSAGSFSCPLDLGCCMRCRCCCISRSLRPLWTHGMNQVNASDASAPVHAGRFIEAQFFIAGMLVTDPVMGSSSTVDSKGVSYATSSGVVYS